MVTLTYLDTSAAMKLLVAEPESAVLLASLQRQPAGALVASWLLHTELHCAAGRHPESISHQRVADVLDRVSLVDLTRGDLVSAGTHAPLRSQDAIHLAVALRLGVERVLTYDEELSRAAASAGLLVESPR